MSDEPDGYRETPPTVIGAIAAGVAPAPFLVTYSVLFILHGTVFPVDPPDITGSRGGEALAGVVALAFLAVIVIGLGWLLSQRTRWLFLAGQAATLAVSVDFLLDSSSGGPAVPLVLALTSTRPSSWAAFPVVALSGNLGREVAAGSRPGRHAQPGDHPSRESQYWDGTADYGDPAYPAPSIWVSAESDGGPVDPNPGGGHSARTPHSA